MLDYGPPNAEVFDEVASPGSTLPTAKAERKGVFTLRA